MFDPYQKWLGIPESERPPTYYQLLGISPEERDGDVIEAAAARRVAHVRTFEAGPLACECARMLKELAKARATLLDPEERRAYDARLVPDAVEAPPLRIVTEERSSLALTPRRATRPKRTRLGVVLGLAALAVGAGIWSRGRRPEIRPGAIQPGPVASDPTPTEVHPAVLRVTVEPVGAELVVSGRGATSRRRGDHWEVTVAEPDGAHAVTFDLTSAGYPPLRRQFFPAPGERRELALRLVREPAPEPPPVAVTSPPPVAVTSPVGASVMPAPAETKTASPPAPVPAPAPPPSPFPGRVADRAALVKREGGSVESEKAVARGLDWLARHQRPDGAWSLDHHAQCQIPGCPTDKAMVADTAATGLALLAFLGAGHIHTEDGPYREAVRRGLDWIVAHERPDGALSTTGTGGSLVYSFGIGALALAEGYAMSHDPTLREPTQRAIDCAIGYQKGSDGGWRYEYGQPADTSVSGWIVSALHAARLGGLKVPDESFTRYGDYLDKAAADSFKSSYAYLPGREAASAMTAAALLDRTYLGWPRDFPSLLRGARLVVADLELTQERNVYYWYYATQLLQQIHGKPWPPKVLKLLRDGLVLTQVVGNGCDRGSWHPLLPQPDQWGKTAGRVYQTAMSVLILEVYYRYPPLDRRDEPSPGKARTAASPRSTPGGVDP